MEPEDDVYERRFIRHLASAVLIQAIKDACITEDQMDRMRRRGKNANKNSGTTRVAMTKEREEARIFLIGNGDLDWFVSREIWMDLAEIEYGPFIKYIRNISNNNWIIPKGLMRDG